MLREVKLNTLHMYDDHDHNDKDYPLWESIARYMHGEIALVIDSVSGDGKFVFLCLKDEEKDKELCYMMEQDSMTGCFINDREGFDREWAEDEYTRDSSLYLNSDCCLYIGI